MKCPYTCYHLHDVQFFISGVIEGSPSCCGDVAVYAASGKLPKEEIQMGQYKEDIQMGQYKEEIQMGQYKEEIQMDNTVVTKKNEMSLYLLPST